MTGKTKPVSIRLTKAEIDQLQLILYGLLWCLLNMNFITSPLRTTDRQSLISSVMALKFFETSTSSYFALGAFTSFWSFTGSVPVARPSRSH
jgi:hypothetical protein